MKFPRPSQIIVVFALMLLCSLLASAGENTAGVEIRKASFEPFPGAEEIHLEGHERPVYLATEVEFTNHDFASATVVERHGGGPGLALVLTEEAARRMAQLTTERINQPMAVLIDGEVIMLPVIRSMIQDKVVIDGNFTFEEAEQLAANFR